MSTIKQIFKSIIIYILKFEAKLVLKKYQPKIIGVTGSVGKTSTKDAIHQVLSPHFFTVKSEKSYNSEFGLPLTILGCGSAWNDIFGWLEIIFYGLKLIIFKHKYPEWLVLEIGADKPNDIKSVTEWVKFDIAVLTYLPDVPVHIEFFKSKDEVIEEKMSLIRSVSDKGTVVINYDDPNSRGFLSELKANVITYGFDAKSDFIASQEHIFYTDELESKVPKGFTFKVDHNGKNLPVKVNGVIGNHQIYPILAAIAVGNSLGINMISLVDSISSYEPPAGRLRILAGIKDTIILDDTYNASPAAMEAGLLSLEKLETKGKKWAVLGDMLELGKHTVEAHKKVGELCAKICDEVITVGLRTKFTDEVLREKNFSENKMKHFDDSVQAGAYLQNKIKAGDLIFVKGSQSMRMEKVVLEIMAQPENREKLLVRQEKEWSKK